MVQWVQLVAKPDSLSLIRRTHMVEGENACPQIATLTSTCELTSSPLSGSMNIKGESISDHELPSIPH